MGLLDDLKREADQARLAKQSAEAKQAELERIYRSNIAPRLIDIHRYLVEILNHLEEAKWIVTVEFDIPGLGRTDNFRQGEHRIFIDSHETPRKVTLQCVRAVPHEQKFSVALDKVDELRQFLVANQVVFSDWPLRDGLGQIISTTVQAKLKIRAWLSFEADIDSSRIKVVSHNFESLDQREYFFGYSAIDENWLDDLGHYLLRKRKFLGRQEMSDEARERLRRVVAMQQAQKKQEQEPPSFIQTGSKPTDSGFLKVLRGRLFKTEKPN